MKKILLACLLFSLCLSRGFAQKDGSQKPLSKADIQFREKQFDFSDIVQGDKVSKKFSFRNAGTEPLMILNVQTTCGCTATDWPKQPIPPGDSSSLMVTFNSAKKIGRINKIVTIYTNGLRPEERLKITGNVLPSTAQSPDEPVKAVPDSKKE
jgi:hypothetical protein